MVPGAILVSKAPYRMNTCELVELKLQLEELTENRDIIPSVSQWGAPIISLFYALKYFVVLNDHCTYSLVRS